jgi:hypothetical protein
MRSSLLRSLVKPIAHPKSLASNVKNLTVIYSGIAILNNKRPGLDA